ncbi:hypothetical protein PYW07_007855 [Mythimna separata]|uniref:TRAF3-interacting protein 1 n=1 Tax=Mythimna separata TaxID=271217 RepID=A0AAD8DV60_MYTSE|nr:hypothetical protein PYW07_007855 [Mythimna separata]
MEKELDPDVIKATQVALGKYVKRPPLSEKLLKKPPFRFLHDVFTTVLKTTGFFGNLFEENELVSDNVKDRDSKISFLNKVIFVLSFTTGKSLAAKPSKIVAGQEPEKTNELLQCLAKALDEKLSSDEAVKKYKESTKSAQNPETKNKEPIKPTKKATDSKKLTSRSNDKLSSQKNDVTRTATKQDKEKAEVKSKRKENGSVKPEPQNLKKIQQSKTINAKNGKDNNKEKKDLPTDDNIQKRSRNILTNSTEREKGHETLNRAQSQESNTTVEKEDLLGKQININQLDVSPRIEQDVEGKLNSSYTITENELNSSSSSNDLNEIANNNKQDEIHSQEIKENKETAFIDVGYQNPTNTEFIVDLKPKSLDIDVNFEEAQKINTQALIEPENKIINTEKDSVTLSKGPLSTTSDSKMPRPPSVRPSSSRPGAPRMREKLDNVIKDPDNLLLGKVNIIIENTQNEEEEETSLLVIEQHGAFNSVPQDQQELQLSSNEHGHLVQQILDSQKELSHITGKTEIEWQFGAQKAREAMNQEIEQLRFNIQALSRVANPLGKLLDHIQEDVEVMRQELHQWSNIYEDVTKEMLKQKTLNEDSLTPFHTKLKQIERDIEEKRDKINDLKIMIHKNGFRIEKLLTSGSVQ